MASVPKFGPSVTSSTSIPSQAKAGQPKASWSAGAKRPAPLVGERFSRRFRIEDVYPAVDGGRYPVKRIAGEPVDVWADVFRDGHDVIAADLMWRRAEDTTWQRTPMRHHQNDRWFGRFVPRGVGRYVFQIAAWSDAFATWRREVSLKRGAGLDIALEIREGLALISALKPADE